MRTANCSPPRALARKGPGAREKRVFAAPVSDWSPARRSSAFARASSWRESASRFEMTAASAGRLALQPLEQRQAILDFCSGRATHGCAHVGAQRLPRDSRAAT